MIGGTTYSFGPASPTHDDAYLLKTDSAGKLLWSKTFGSNLYEEGNAAIQTIDGGYAIAGQTNSFGQAGSVRNVYLVKTDSIGNSSCAQTDPATKDTMILMPSGRP